MALSLKHKQFVTEYLIDMNATRAAIRAGYSSKCADVTGSRMLANASVRAAIEEAQIKRSEKLQINAEYVLEGIRETTLAARFAREYAGALKGYELLGKHL